ncbi:PREDICTED: zinc finger protein 91-like isoform X1 [Polistes canadensis]|uniref:zinc finger protein 91-like isoform X1 n=2 Tax=Polistes canadensis TaxID=91411 RepID=UPI000718E6BE|nr:PREDICTED: zinc finger protein 91-like isoform X1 [Polistes canadensis]
MVFASVDKRKRRCVYGSKRNSLKMSGRPPRLRALRPRPQQQQQVKTDITQKMITDLEDNEAESETKNDPVNNQLKENKKIGESYSNDDHQMENQNVNGKSFSTLELFNMKDINEEESLKDQSDFNVYLEQVKKEHQQMNKSVHDTSENQCPMCPYDALSSRDLETHQRVHHFKRKFFRCAKCSYVTHVRARYTKHVKYHSMPMIKCDACDFSTPYKWNLDRHTRNHGGGGTFQCRACNFTADIRQSLTVHETNHHEPPVGQSSRRSNMPFERKPRNSPKRYNQVGASDFREPTGATGNTTAINLGESFNTDQSIDDKKSVLAGADCIPLKCEEKACQFVTSWDSEMQRHLAECHAPIALNKSRKPLPMLIPLNPVNNKSNTILNSNTPATLLKVPRVRVRPELAQIARDTEMAKLYGNKEMNSKKNVNSVVNAFERKNASFFDKLKEKLSSSVAMNKGMPEVAVSNMIDLKCWCTFKASSMEELASHKQTHHTALSVSVGMSRCPKCRRRCKSTTDLEVHMQYCQQTSRESPVDSSFEKVTECSELRMTAYSSEYTFPSHLEWDTSLGGHNSSGSSVEGTSAHPNGRRVFKCPHCPFWASTASRFHVHIVGHLNRKPFECSLCAYRSNWRWDITKHIKLKAAKDPVHLTARVLMTDETGRRNYSKYNKYLAQVEQQVWDDQNMEERSIEEVNFSEPPTKVLILSNKDYSQTAELPSSVDSKLITNNDNRNENIISLRHPPPLKVSVKNRGQSLLKNNTTNVQNSSISISTSTTVSPTNTTTITMDDNKRTMWKCKKCNYKDSNKDTVLLHVKSHYEAIDQNVNEERNIYGCGDCPFSASDTVSLSMHRVHHRPNNNAIFKCYLCPYYVNTKAELLEHARLHGEELAVVHQQNMDFRMPVLKSKLQTINSEDGDNNIKKETTIEQNIPTTSKSNGASLSSVPTTSSNRKNPVLLDTRHLPDAPLVWVTRPDGTLIKMLKCRYCPYVTSRRAEVCDHEMMHVDYPSQDPFFTCDNCSYTSAHREVMNAHVDMHSGSSGIVHCLVDQARSDSQQLNDLLALLNLTHMPALGAEPDLRDLRLVYCCGKCPARFLCEKELRIHLRYHMTELAYMCQWCSYAARQPAHLVAHQKAHSTEYQERTKYLLTLHGYSQRFPPPPTACVEASDQEFNDTSNNVAWIVIKVSEDSSYSTNSSSFSGTSAQRSNNQVFTCAKCPARYFKLDALEYHMTLHGSNNRFKCSECDYSSKTSQNLIKHQVVHRRHNETNGMASSNSSTSTSLPDPQFGVFMRGNPNFVYPGYLRNGRLKEKRYKCHKCPSAFEKREQYRVHLTLHGAKQRYRCDTCDYSVKYYANYIQHLKKHQANAEAQASRRRLEDDTISVDSDGITDLSMSNFRSGKTIGSGTAAASVTTISMSTINTIAGSGGITSISTPLNSMHVSNQDKQALILMQKKGMLPSSNEIDIEIIRCQNCPFSTTDKEAMDAHKRRHGIERMTPSCPHCDYIPRRDENVGEHIRLHFTRLYKPESYLIIELLTLTMRKVAVNGKEDQKKNNMELLFKECSDGRFFPLTDGNSSSFNVNASHINNCKEKVIVDPNTGETKQRFFV